jgi:hypothetical protein
MLPTSLHNVRHVNIVADGCSVALALSPVCSVSKNKSACFLRGARRSRNMLRVTLLSVLPSLSAVCDRRFCSDLHLVAVYPSPLRVHPRYPLGCSRWQFLYPRWAPSGNSCILAAYSATRYIQLRLQCSHPCYLLATDVSVQYVTPGTSACTPVAC